MRFTFFLCMSFIASVFNVDGKEKYLALSKGNLKFRTDSVVTDSSKKDRLPEKPGSNSKSKSVSPEEITIIRPKDFNFFPGTSLQQYLKGQAAGVYIQEPSGEPGTEQNMFIRGLSTPLFSARELYQTQPLVVIDGVPVFSKEHYFAYDLQQPELTFNRIGTSTNFLAGIQPENIVSIEILKDPVDAARYGVRATNGVIYIKTKQADSRRAISVNSYVGMATPGNITTINGASENKFRAPFYQRYATFEQTQNIPSYLTDSLYNIYYGPSNWTDLYYRNALVYGVDASASGGNSRSNFRVSLGNQKNNGVADQAGIDRYSAAFIVNMIPKKWLSITSSVNASQLIRNRNKYMRDRFAEVRYFPNLTNPPSPNKDYYSKYLKEYDKSFDKNRNNLINGYVGLDFTFGKLLFNSRFALDYNESSRDVFYPSTLMETNSYVSNYFGYNQRYMIENTATYDLNLNESNKLKLQAGQSFQWDTFRYSYNNAYWGTSDFVKVNLITDPDGDYGVAVFPNQLTSGFLNTLNYKFLDNLQNNLMSFFGRGNYSYKDKYSVALMLRADAASTAQPTSRWFFSPIVSAKWDAKKEFLSKSEKVSELVFNAGYSRLGRLQTDNKYAAGPNYVTDIGYSGETRINSFYQVATLNRSYSAGWVGYNIPWAYSEQVNAGITLGLFKDRLKGSLEVYSRADKNQIIGLPSYMEYGYSNALMPGMNVNNSGIDLSVSGSVLNPKKKLRWISSINLNANRNKLTALPGGVSELIVGDKLLRTGESIDSYWLYENKGIYTDLSQIPVNPETGSRLSIFGVQLGVGDPIWKDSNGDYIIDNKDKVLKGHILPILSGGFSNQFTYKNINLGFDLYYNLGRDVMNEEMSRRFDFVNNQSANNITSVKEITFWEKHGDYSKYPIYNPWSAVTPYRLEQDLFLENASFVKLRSVTLGYNFTELARKRSRALSNLYGYITVNNVFTLTPYSGRDPELVNYAGYDTGYGHTIPRTFTMGFKLNL